MLSILQSLQFDLEARDSRRADFGLSVKLGGRLHTAMVHAREGLDNQGLRLGHWLRLMPPS